MICEARKASHGVDDDLYGSDRLIGPVGPLDDPILDSDPSFDDQTLGLAI